MPGLSVQESLTLTVAQLAKMSIDQSLSLRKINLVSTTTIESLLALAAETETSSLEQCVGMSEPLPRDQHQENKDLHFSFNSLDDLLRYISTRVLLIIRSSTPNAYEEVVTLVTARVLEVVLAKMQAKVIELVGALDRSEIKPGEFETASMTDVDVSERGELLLMHGNDSLFEGSGHPRTVLTDDSSLRALLQTAIQKLTTSYYPDKVPVDAREVELILLLLQESGEIDCLARLLGVLAEEELRSSCPAILSAYVNTLREQANNLFNSLKQVAWGTVIINNLHERTAIPLFVHRLLLDGPILLESILQSLPPSYLATWHAFASTCSAHLLRLYYMLTSSHRSFSLAFKSVDHLLIGHFTKAKLIGLSAHLSPIEDHVIINKTSIHALNEVEAAWKWLRIVQNEASLIIYLSSNGYSRSHGETDDTSQSPTRLSLRKEHASTEGMYRYLLEFRSASAVQNTFLLALEVCAKYRFPGCVEFKSGDQPVPSGITVDHLSVILSWLIRVIFISPISPIIADHPALHLPSQSVIPLTQRKLLRSHVNFLVEICGGQLGALSRTICTTISTASSESSLGSPSQVNAIDLVEQVCANLPPSLYTEIFTFIWRHRSLQRVLISSALLPTLVEATNARIGEEVITDPLSHTMTTRTTAKCLEIRKRLRDSILTLTLGLSTETQSQLVEWISSLSSHGRNRIYTLLLLHHPTRVSSRHGLASVLPAYLSLFLEVSSQAARYDEWIVKTSVSTPQANVISSTLDNTRLYEMIFELEEVPLEESNLSSSLTKALLQSYPRSPRAAVVTEATSDNLETLVSGPNTNDNNLPSSVTLADVAVTLFGPNIQDREAKSRLARQDADIIGKIVKTLIHINGQFPSQGLHRTSDADDKSEEFDDADGNEDDDDLVGSALLDYLSTWGTSSLTVSPNSSNRPTPTPLTNLLNLVSEQMAQDIENLLLVGRCPATFRQTLGVPSTPFWLRHLIYISDPTTSVFSSPLANTSTSSYESSSATDVSTLSQPVILMLIVVALTPRPASHRAPSAPPFIEEMSVLNAWKSHPVIGCLIEAFRTASMKASIALITRSIATASAYSFAHIFSPKSPKPSNAAGDGQHNHGTTSLWRDNIMRYAIDLLLSSPPMEPKVPNVAHRTLHPQHMWLQNLLQELHPLRVMQLCRYLRHINALPLAVKRRPDATTEIDLALRSYGLCPHLPTSARLSKLSLFIGGNPPATTPPLDGFSSLELLSVLSELRETAIYRRRSPINTFSPPSCSACTHDSLLESLHPDTISPTFPLRPISELSEDEIYLVKQAVSHELVRRGLDPSPFDAMFPLQRGASLENTSPQLRTEVSPLVTPLPPRPDSPILSLVKLVPQPVSPRISTKQPNATTSGPSTRTRGSEPCRSTKRLDAFDAKDNQSSTYDSEMSSLALPLDDIRDVEIDIDPSSDDEVTYEVLQSVPPLANDSKTDNMENPAYIDPITSTDSHPSPLTVLSSHNTGLTSLHSLGTTEGNANKDGINSDDSGDYTSRTINIGGVGDDIDYKQSDTSTPRLADVSSLPSSNSSGSTVARTDNPIPLFSALVPCVDADSIVTLYGSKRNDILALVHGQVQSCHIDMLPQALVRFNKKLKEDSELSLLQALTAVALASADGAQVISLPIQYLDLSVSSHNAQIALDGCVNDIRDDYLAVWRILQEHLKFKPRRPNVQNTNEGKGDFSSNNSNASISHSSNHKSRSDSDLNNGTSGACAKGHVSDDALSIDLAKTRLSSFLDRGTVLTSSIEWITSLNIATANRSNEYGESKRYANMDSTTASVTKLECRISPLTLLLITLKRFITSVVSSTTPKQPRDPQGISATPSSLLDTMSTVSGITPSSVPVITGTLMRHLLRFDPMNKLSRWITQLCPLALHDLFGHQHTAASHTINTMLTLDSDDDVYAPVVNLLEMLTSLCSSSGSGESLNICHIFHLYAIILTAIIAVELIPIANELS